MRTSWSTSMTTRRAFGSNSPSVGWVLAPVSASADCSLLSLVQLELGRKQPPNTSPELWPDRRVRRFLCLPRSGIFWFPGKFVHTSVASSSSAPPRRHLSWRHAFWACLELFSGWSNGGNVLPKSKALLPNYTRSASQTTVLHKRNLGLLSQSLAERWLA